MWCSTNSSSCLQRPTEAYNSKENQGHKISNTMFKSVHTKGKGFEISKTMIKRLLYTQTKQFEISNINGLEISKTTIKSVYWDCKLKDLKFQRPWLGTWHQWTWNFKYHAWLRLQNETRKEIGLTYLKFQTQSHPQDNELAGCQNVWTREAVVLLYLRLISSALCIVFGWSQVSLCLPVPRHTRIATLYHPPPPEKESYYCA